MCSQCNQFFTGHAKKHTCDRFLCKQCKCKCDSYGDLSLVAKIRCDACCRFFFSQKCFHLHLRRGASRLYPYNSLVCSRVMACMTCGRDPKAKNGVRTDRNAYETDHKNAEHVCFKSRCRACGMLDIMTNHQCYVYPLDPFKEGFQERQKKKRGVLQFFDVECCDETRVCHNGIERNFYVPNLVILQREDGEEHLWEGKDCMFQFCEFVFLKEDSLANSNGKNILYAHNAWMLEATTKMRFFTLPSKMSVCKKPIVISMLT